MELLARCRTTSVVTGLLVILALVGCYTRNPERSQLTSEVHNATRAVLNARRELVRAKIGGDDEAIAEAQRNVAQAEYEKEKAGVALYNAFHPDEPKPMPEKAP